MHKVYEGLDESNRIVVASPIYFYSVTAQTKLVIDRAQALWSRKRLEQRAAAPSGRKGFFLSVAATKGKRLFDGAILTVRYFFDAIDAESCGELVYAGFDEKGAIQRHPTAMKECFEAGSKFVQ
jgi:multimeric flavodoxin WrbA